MWEIAVPVCIVICAAVYLFYRNGHLTISAKRALLYVGSLKGDRARFIACTGHIKRVIRPQKSQIHHFFFKASTSSGEVWAELYDQEKQRLMHLDHDEQHAAVFLNAPGRYVLAIRFKHATGSYILEQGADFSQHTHRI